MARSTGRLVTTQDLLPLYTQYAKMYRKKILADLGDQHEATLSEELSAEEKDK